MNSDLLEKLRNTFITRTPHAQAIGIRLGTLESGRATMTLPASPRWLGDPLRGLMHPGPLTVLADSCAGVAIAAGLDQPTSLATLDLRMDYLRPAGPDQDVHCEARMFRRTRNVAFIDAELWQADRAELIALARGAFMLATPDGRQRAPAAAQATRTPLDEPGGAPWQAPAESEPVSASRQVPYADFLGIRVSQTAQGPLYRLPFRDELIGNPRLPALHGGVVAGFCETAAVLHVVQTLRGAKFPKSVDFSIDYLRSGRPRETIAQCDLVRIGTRVALVQIRCWQSHPDYPITVARVHLLLAESDQRR